MSDRHVNALQLLLDHAKRALAQDPPDYKTVETLLNEGLTLVISALVEGAIPDPYRDRNLRPGLRIPSEEPTDV